MYPNLGRPISQKPFESGAHTNTACGCPKALVLMLSQEKQEVSKVL
jgi:hypothetical protein